MVMSTWSLSVLCIEDTDMAELPHHSSQTVRKGRPCSEIDEEQVKFLVSKGFSKSKIAKILGVSRQTFYNRYSTWTSGTFDKFMMISETDLDEKVKEIKLTHPNDGEVMMSGHLRSQGIRIPRSKLRASLHRVDPEGIANRKAKAVKRRVYHVEGANHVWHVDGNHKMIQWRIVVHGGIDGYSRLITFLKCHTDNKSTSVLSAFMNGVAKYGLPKAVRTDHGGENIEIWRHMLQESSSTSSVITGSSTHNERIERLWRDVHRSVIVTFADTFRLLGSEQLLNPLNEVDIYCLHTVYLPVITRALDAFVSAWNNHPVSTEHNQTPEQQFFTSFTKTQDLLSEDSTDDEEAENDVTSLPANEAVIVPRCSFLPCDQLKESLEDTIAQHADARAQYKAIINVCGHHLQNSCSDCT